MKCMSDYVSVFKCTIINYCMITCMDTKNLSDSSFFPRQLNPNSGQVVNTIFQDGCW